MAGTEPRRTTTKGFFDVPSLRREIAYIVARARAHDSRLVTFEPVIFFSTTTGDAWMLDPSDCLAACLARDGVREPVRIEDWGSKLAIEWTGSYGIDGDAMTFLENATGRVTTVHGYPAREIEKAARAMMR